MRVIAILLLLCTGTSFCQIPLFQDVTNTAGTGAGSKDNNAVLVGDFNGDGLEDLFVTSRTEENRLYKNNGNGSFEDVTAGSGIATSGLTMTGAWGDLDNDGDLDLFIGNYYTQAAQSPNYLFLNDGNGIFTDISVSAGINMNSQTRSVHMVDIDNDGYLDIYVCNLLQQNVYWRNNGDNTFTNLVFSAGLTDSSISMGAVFFDYDNDGDQDVYLTHDGNQQYVMYENNGQGRFIDVSEETGLDLAGQGMGVDFTDINNDGHMDIYVTNLGPNFLFLNDGTGKYDEIAESAGVTNIAGMSWGCFFFDFDNDGWEDLYIVNDSNFSPTPNKLYRNNKDNTFSCVSTNNPVLSSFYAGRSGNWADLNNDGLMDIVIANGQNFRSLEIIENRDNANNWIGFELEGTTVAPDAFGTRVQASTINGIKVDEKTGGSSYASQSSHRVYFGLGQGDASDIIISWPDGSRDFFSTLAINQVHKITQGMSPMGTDQDNDGYTSEEDCNDTNPEVNPGMNEVPYNGLDDDCDPFTLDDDLDGDGYLIMDDCDDNNFNANPGLAELPYNGVDDDCDPTTLDDDLDEDGFPQADDCDDENANVNPDASEETYNGIDDDCEPTTLDDDLDEDGYVMAEDCDDDNPDINPAAEELPNNGIDEDCDGMDLISSTDNQLIEMGLSVFPNPAKDYINISISSNISIYTSSSQLIHESKNVARVDVSALEPGVYFLKVQLADRMSSKVYKVVIL